LFNKFKISHDTFLILIVVFLAAVLRFYNFWNLPFMHDEFSAILRTYYDNISQLIEIGVKQNDSHPAGVQVFIYFWIKLFGLNEASLKFPFVIMGTASVYVIYLIGKRWFGKSSALLSALIMAIIQFGIFYSQLARPYSPGLLFVLLSTYFWTKLVFDKEPKLSSIVAYVLISSIASYLHAFSLFFVFIQGISGIIFLRGKRLNYYVLFNLLIFVFYLPHISIFLAQIGRGDIGGWLSKPDNLFLFDFVYYIFHFSWFFILTVLIISIVLVSISPNKRTDINKFRLLSLSWFAIAYLVAHIYSIFRSPIIQYSTLLFVFPFLLLFAFSFIGEIKSRIKYLVVFLITTVGVFTLTVNRQHYSLMYTQGFDGIAIETANDLAGAKQNNIAIIMQATEHRMFDYYFDKNDMKNDYLSLDNENSISDIDRYLRKNNPETLIYGWADYAKLEYLAYFKDRYKYTIHEKQFFNSEYYLFSNISGNLNASEEGKRLIKKIPLHEHQVLYKSNKPGYSKSIEIKLDTIDLSIYDVINIRAKVSHSLPNADALLVFELKNKEGKLILWSSSKFSDFYSDEDSSFYYVYHSKRLMSIYPLSEGSILKTYIWKRDNSMLEVKNIEIYFTNISPAETGLYDKIPAKGFFD